MSNLTQRRHQGGGGVGVGGGGGNGPSMTTMDPLHGSHGQPSSAGGYGYGSSTLNRWLPDSSSISYPTSNWEAKELYKSEQSAAGLSWKRDILTIMTRFVTGFDGLLLLLTSFLYMFGPEKVVGNWFGSMHTVPPSARDICSALTQASGGLSFMCACLLLAAAPFVTARHAPWLAFAHWVSTLSISKNIFDSAPYDLGVDRFIVAAAASLHLFPALAYTVLTIANAITREDPMMIAPWKSLQRGRTPANLVFFGLGCFYVLWSISWMLFPSYTVKRSIYDRLSSTPLKYAANNEYAVAGPFFFLGLLHIAFSGLASMTRELPLAAAFGHALNMGLDAVSWFSGGAMDAAAFRPSILYGALILHLLLAVAHSILSYFVEPHTGLVQMAQETANVLQQNQTMAGLGETVKETLGMGAGAEGAGAGIGQQASHLYQKVKESLTPSETYGTSAYTTTPAGSMTEQASQYAEKAKDTAQTYAEKAKDTVQSYAEKGKESGKGMMQQSSGMTGTPSFKVHEETTPASSTKAKSGDKGTHIERGPGGATESKTSQHTAST